VGAHPTYLAALTFPRFALAILVVIFHFGLHLPLFGEGVFAQFFSHGAIAVSFFFFLSGFVLSYNYNSPEKLTGFFRKRIARLYPSYVLTFFAVLVSKWLLEIPVGEIGIGAVHLLGLQAWVPGYSLEYNFPSWSISVEFFFYAMFPILFWVMRKLQWKTFAVLCSGIIVLGWLQHILTLEFIYDPNRFFLDQLILYFPLFHFSTFVAGFLGGRCVERLRELEIHALWYSIAAGIGILAFIVLLSFDNPFRAYGHNGGMIPVFALICLGLALDRQFFTPLFGAKPFIFLGDISYGIYMWQFPVFLGVSHLFQTSEVSLFEFLVYLILLILIAAISFHFVEKPLRKKFSQTRMEQ
jgi:peptidoglycan/LPS O-acetylase OafA/YrhL